jgi:hypothetical protein
LIDAAIYPGSSGSPVLLYNQGAWVDRSNNVIGGVRVSFLGIVYGVKVHAAPGELVTIPAPTQRTASLTALPNNLGVCIKSSRVFDFEPELIMRGLYALPDGYMMRALPK